MWWTYTKLWDQGAQYVIKMGSYMIKVRRVMASRWIKLWDLYVQSKWIKMHRIQWFRWIELCDQDARLSELWNKNAQLSEQGVQLCDQDAHSREQDVQLCDQDAQLIEQDVQLCDQYVQSSDQDTQLCELDVQVYDQYAQWVSYMSSYEIKMHD